MKPINSIAQAKSALDDIDFEPSMLTTTAELCIVYLARCMPMLLKAIDLDNTITGSTMSGMPLTTSNEALVRILKDAILKLDMYKRYPDPIPDSLKSILDDASRDFHNILRALMGDAT